MATKTIESSEEEGMPTGAMKERRYRESGVAGGEMGSM